MPAQVAGTSILLCIAEPPLFVSLVTTAEHWGCSMSLGALLLTLSTYQFAGKVRPGL